MTTIQKDIEEIRDSLQSDLSQALQQAIEFVRKYAVDEGPENELIEIKFLLNLESDESKRSEFGQKLMSVLEEVKAKYDPVAVEEKRQHKQALTSIEQSGKLTPEEDRRQVLRNKFTKLEVKHPVVLRVNNLTKVYRSTGFTLDATKMELKLGQITGLLGENATGKSTLFNILAGELTRTSGAIEFPEFKDQNWFAVKKYLAYVPQELPDWRDSLLNTLRFEAAMQGIKGVDNEFEVKSIIGRLGLIDHIHKSWRQLSGGFKLRFSLAKALIRQPKVLILDEPLANLDIKTQIVVLEDLYNLVHSYRNPIALLISSQHIHEIEAYADHLYYMDDGRLEDLGAISSYQKDRKINVFELSGAFTQEDLENALQDLSYEKIWTEGFTTFISTPIQVNSDDLFANLSRANIPLEYFRDISRSVKTRFYGEDL